MGLLDWLRDGPFGDRARMRHVEQKLAAEAEQRTKDDPSGPHHFGRRAHRPDPQGHYDFGSGAKRRPGGL
jgi:hypothetical protein